MGIDAALYYETYKNFVEKKIKWCDMSWVLEDNKGMLAAISPFRWGLFIKGTEFMNEIYPLLKMPMLLYTGATGFIGSHLS